MDENHRDAIEDATMMRRKVRPKRHTSTAVANVCRLHVDLGAVLARDQPSCIQTVARAITIRRSPIEAGPS